MTTNRLCSTEEASRETGLSKYELRLGWKQGRYPALAIGSRDARQVRLRWNIPLLVAAIRKNMTEQTKEDA